MDVLLTSLDKIPVQKNGLDELKMILKKFYEFLKKHSNYLKPHFIFYGYQWE